MKPTFKKTKKEELKYLNLIFKLTNAKTVEYSPNEYDHYDAIVNDKFYIEYKIRDVDYEKTILEVYKYQQLYKYKYKFYIVTDLDSTYIFNLNEIDMKTIETRDMLCPETTCGNTKMVMKKCFLIDKKLSTKDIDISNNQIPKIKMILNMLEAGATEEYIIKNVKNSKIILTSIKLEKIIDFI